MRLDHNRAIVNDAREKLVAFLLVGRVRARVSRDSRFHVGYRTPCR